MGTKIALVSHNFSMSKWFMSTECIIVIQIALVSHDFLVGINGLCKHIPSLRRPLVSYLNKFYAVY